MRRVALRSLFAAMALTGGALGESPANAQQLVCDRLYHGPFRAAG